MSGSDCAPPKERCMYACMYGMHVVVVVIWLIAGRNRQTMKPPFSTATIMALRHGWLVRFPAVLMGDVCQTLARPNATRCNTDATFYVSTFLRTAIRRKSVTKMRPKYDTVYKTAWLSAQLNLGNYVRNYPIHGDLCHWDAIYERQYVDGELWSKLSMEDKQGYIEEQNEASLWLLFFHTPTGFRELCWNMWRGRCRTENSSSVTFVSSSPFCTTMQINFISRAIIEQKKSS